MKFRTRTCPLKARFLAIAAAIAVLAIGCTSSDTHLTNARNDQLRYFGFALVDCGIDDPFDGSARTSYVTEVAPFSNAGHMCASGPADVIVDRLKVMSDHEMKAVLSVQEVLFLRTQAGLPGHQKYDLHPEFRERWQTFVAANDLAANHSSILAFYVFDEPVWNDVSYAELKTAADLVKESFPSIPTLIMEAYPTIDDLIVPESIDWIALVRFGILDPNSDEQYRAELRTLKAKRTGPDQKIVIVMDGWWRADLHGARGIREADMAAVARNYYQLAESDPDVVGIAVHAWPGLLTDGRERGSRNLPQRVVEQQAQIGRIITRK